MFFKMSGSIRWIDYFLILLFIHNSNGAFYPNTADYNAYGLKIAMNDLLFVQIQNDNYIPTFLVQFGPYGDTSSSQCFMSYPNSVDHYIYTVAVSRNQRQFFFAGEMINGKNGTFIGVAKYNSSSSACETSFLFSLQYFYNYEHQEYFIIDVEPEGRRGYGFSNQFVFLFDSENTATLNIWNGNLTWPHASFMPHAVDLTDSFGVIAGFIHNPIDAIAVFIPMIYLINYNSSNGSPIIVDQYGPNATVGTWQDSLTNSDADTYSAKYDMSVSINEVGNVLVGMQFINRVFLFSVDKTKPNKLVYISRNTNGRSLGNGKGVAWLQNGVAAVLVNSYSLTYQWSSSEIYFYDIQNSSYNSSSTPLSTFPNYHQLLPLSFSMIFINIISSPSSLALLDDQHNILILSPTLPGYFPTIDETGSMPVFTRPQVCLPGTYKNQTGVHDCILCPTGTRNPGNSNLQCIPCSSGSFCPLGSVTNISQSALETTVQVMTYPRSPESIIFDEVLLQNMFYIGSGHCLLVSPLFWTLMVASFSIIIIIIMGVLKLCINHPHGKRTRHILKSVFKHTDLIGEGNLWIGGLASFSVLVLVSFAYSFSSYYIKQYPIENTSDSHFACDLSLRNAKFETNLQSLSISVAEEQQKMFDLLNNQTFYLNIDFINTFVNCNVISIQALVGTKWSTIRWSKCANTNSILSLSILLPYQHMSVQVLLDNTQTIGALRIGLWGSGQESERFSLKELNFYQTFSKYGQALAQTLPVALAITKVINQTLPMSGEESDFGGIYIPTFTVDLNSLFLTQDQYVRATSPLTTLTIVLSETPYFVKNLQQPIAKLSEIIFHNILFTVVCLEIFGLIFLFHKLIFKPLYNLLVPNRVTDNKKQSISDIEIHEITGTL